MTDATETARYALLTNTEDTATKQELDNVRNLSMESNAERGAPGGPKAPLMPRESSERPSQTGLHDSYRAGLPVEELSQMESDIQFRIEAANQHHRKVCDELEHELDEVRQAIAMHEKSNEALLPEEASSAHSGPECLHWVDETGFRTACMLVIVLNMVVMVLELRPDPPEWCHKADNYFLSWYCFELTVKALYFQGSLLIGPFSIVWWNWLDLIIVLSGVLDQWIIGSQKGAAGAGGIAVWGIHFKTSNLRGLRLLRLFRVARALKLVKGFLQSDMQWTEGSTFEQFMMGIILMNAIMMWLELDYPSPFFTWLENVMLCLYFFEVACKMKRAGPRLFLMGSNRTWNLLDAAVVTGGCLDQWALPLYDLVIEMINGANAAVSKNREDITHAMKILRALRIVRVLRLARVLRHIKPLHRLLTGIVEAMAAMGWVLMLTFLLLYVCAIVFTTLVGHGYIYGDTPPETAEMNFGTVSQSLLSLFKLMNDDQGVVADVITTAPGQVLFYIFMMLGNWMMLAILTSVVSDNMISSSAKVEAEDKKRLENALDELRTRNLMEYFSRFDTDGDGRIKSDDLGRLKHDAVSSHELKSITDFMPEDLEDMMHYLIRYGEDGQQYLPMHLFISKLRHYHSSASERSILQVLEALHYLEAGFEVKLDAALNKLGGMDEGDKVMIRHVAGGKRSSENTATKRITNKRTSLWSMGGKSNSSVEGSPQAPKRDVTPGSGGSATPPQLGALPAEPTSSSMASVSSR